jgi:hypothetical protein
MGCVYHPDRPETARCYKCKADLCSTCAMELAGGRIICHRCLVAVSLGKVKSETNRQRRARPPRRFSLSRLWPPSYLQALLVSGALAVLVLLGLQLFWGRSLPRRRIVLRPERPAQVLTDLQFVLEQYAAAHGEQFPETLFQLIPRYLPDVSETRGSLRALQYRLDRSTGYRVRFKGEPNLMEGVEVTRDEVLLPGLTSLRRGK